MSKLTATILAAFAVSACSQSAQRGGAEATTTVAEPKKTAATDVDPMEVSEDDELADELAVTETVTPARPFERVGSPLFNDSDEYIVLRKTVWVRAQPFADAGELGMIRGRRAIKYRSHVVNADCETPWIEVYPQGFACIAAELANAKDIARAERAAKKRASKQQRAMVGGYATASKAARFFRTRSAAEAGLGGRAARGDMVRVSKSVKLEDGRTLWKTQRGEYVDRSAIRRLWGTKWAGIDLSSDDAPTMPFAFAVHRRSPKGSIVVRTGPSRTARKGRKLKARTVVSVLETSDDGAWVRIGEDQWIARADARVVDTVETPDDVGYAERWVDVDLDQQLVVVYAGEKPIYATLASTGRGSRATPTGTYRVTRKKRRTTMASDRSKSQSYSVAVPWATYFHGGYALHSAYWHDAFGKRKSHGCVNLAPKDALKVYSLLGPKLPDDWSVVYSHASQPGSIVRVRSAEQEATIARN